MSGFKIANGVLDGYDGQTSRLILPDSVNEISDNAFVGICKLTDVYIPKTVTRIGKKAFKDCSSVENIYVSSDNAVYKSERGSLYTKDGKTLIAYSKGRAAESFTVPEGVERIGENAFAFCRFLKEIFLPKSLTDISDGAFQYCRKLEKIIIPDGVTNIGVNAFFSCKRLKEITFPKGLTVLNKGMMSFCSELTSAVIPEGVSVIGDMAFFNCSGLKDIVIPESVTGIGRGAFHLCSSLEEIRVPKSVVDIVPGSFSGIHETVTIYINFDRMELLESNLDKSAWAGAVRGFLNRYGSGEVEEAEAEEWRAYINRKNVKAFKLLADDIKLYGFLTEKETLFPSRADSLLEKTTDTECRALLLDYVNRRRSGKRRGGVGIDKRFKLD